LHFIFSIAIENIFVTMLECGVTGVCLYGACVEQRFGRSVSTWAAAHVPAAAPIASSCPGTLTMTPAVTSVCVARCTGSHRAGTIEIPFCESRIVYLWPLKVHTPHLKSHSGRAAARSGCCKESRIIFIAAPSRPGLFYSACVLYVCVWSSRVRPSGLLSTACVCAPKRLSFASLRSSRQANSSRLKIGTNGIDFWLVISWLSQRNECPFVGAHRISIKRQPCSISTFFFISGSNGFFICFAPQKPTPRRVMARDYSWPSSNFICSAPFGDCVLDW